MQQEPGETTTSTPLTPAPDPHPRDLSEALAALVRLVRRDADALVALRRDIHAHPELGWGEQGTIARVRAGLQAAPVTPATLSMHDVERSGLVVDIGSTRPFRRVALRADLDALALPESSGLPFASTVPGVCHACGHDVHTAALVGAGRALAQLEPWLVERGFAVRLLFQPCEEGVPGGAEHFVELGLLDGVDEAFAVHCDPSLEVGRVGLRTGGITAATDKIVVRFRGPGGHTSRPHNTADLTYAMGVVITQLPAVLSRRLDPRAVASLVWGSVHAGDAANAIPSEGVLAGTLRVIDVDAWQQAGPVVESAIASLVAPFGVQVEVEHLVGPAPTMNDARSVEHARAAALAVVGQQAPAPTPQSLGGEDFADMLQVVPGALLRLGTRTPGGPVYDLHRPDLVVDEGALEHGAALLAASALVALDAGPADL